MVFVSVMKQLCLTVILGMALAAPSLQAAVSRGFTSTQSFSAPLALNQPLPAAIPVAPQAPASKSKEANVVTVRPAPTKPKTAVDTRKLDVTAKAFENKNVFVKPKVDTRKARVSSDRMRSLFDSPEFDRVERDPNPNIRAGQANIFAPLPKGKKRTHSLSDWP